MRYWTLGMVVQLISCTFISEEELAFRRGGASGCDIAWYLDEDGDGYGTGISVTSCQAPNDQYVLLSGDCDDSNVSISPIAVEDCSTVDIDENCDGSVNGVVAINCIDMYKDADGDGFGDEEDVACLCVADDTYVTEVGGDCADDDANVRPNVSEICGDGLDNNCDGSANGCGWDDTTSFADAYATYVGGVSKDYTGANVFRGNIGTNDSSVALITSSAFDTSVVDAGRLDIVTVSAGQTVIDGQGLGINSTEVCGFAESVWANSDLNGDGTNDLVVGAPGLTVNGSANVGGMYVFLGPITESKDSGQADAVLQGSTLGDRFANDVTGTQGLIFVGAPNYDAPVVNGGAVFAYDISQSTTVPKFTISSDTVGTRLGYSLDSADVTGDGIDDIAVGAYGANGNKGAVYIFDGSVQGEQSIADAMAVWNGVIADGAIGKKVRFGGDITGDGYNDLLIGGLDIDTVYLVDAGMEGEHSVSTATATFVGPADSFVGYSLGYIGDLNGDNQDDIVLGGYIASSIYVIYGPVQGGYTLDIDSVSLQDSGADQMGIGFIGLDDVTGDGVGDLMVGAKISSLYGFKSGTAFVLQGEGL